MVAITAAPSLLGRHLLTVADLSAAELRLVLSLAGELKATKDVDQLPMLRGKTICMLFEKPSLRTRVSFETAMTQLGGHAIVAAAGDFAIGARETPEDAARVLSRMVDAVVIRTHDHQPLERFASAATVPTINALSAEAHPCQALADMLTIKEHFGSLTGLRLAYIGDANNNVAHSLAQAALLCGMSMTFGAPPTHRPSENALAKLDVHGRTFKSMVRVFSNPKRAVRDADIIYTDVWTSMGEEAFSERNAAALRPYQVDADLLAHANPHAVFMHCLPAHRGQEVSEDVIDGPKSLVFEQAGNRLHAQKALLLALMTDLRGVLT